VTPPQHSFALLWNRSSGWSDSDQERQKIESILSGGGSHLDVRQVERGMDILEQTKALVAGGADVLIAAGGDGTINAAASALVHQKTALGVIPAGTLNHFARDLQIPLEPEKAARVIVDGRPIYVDAASVNGRVFLNNSVLGFFPKYRTTREAMERHGSRDSRFGRFITIVAALWRVFWRLPHLTVSLTIEGRKRVLRTPFVLIGNNEHRMEGLALGSRDSIDRGRLWVYALPACSRWQFLRLAVSLILGRTPRESVFQIFSASHLTIHSRQRRIGVGIDGEMVRMTPPLHYQSLPGALRVVAPSQHAPTERAAD
jgi:diacylglycerol kinase family enzyme